MLSNYDYAPGQGITKIVPSQYKTYDTSELNQQIGVPQRAHVDRSKLPGGMGGSVDARGPLSNYLNSVPGKPVGSRHGINSREGG